MFDDDDPDDESSANGPLHPDDRLWRHPSEVGAAAGTAPVPDRTRRPRVWSVALLAGLAGAAVALSTMALVGRIGSRDDRVDVSQGAATTMLVNPVSVRSIEKKSVSDLARDTSAVMAQITVSAQGHQRHGSALVVRTGGTLLTAETLVRGADSVTVRVADGRIAVGAVTGSDPTTGLAVVQVPLTGLRVISQSEDSPTPGEQAVLVAGLTGPEKPWVSSGIVSSTSGRLSVDGHWLMGLIETDRPVPTAADGGALVTPDGTVVGLCIAPESKTAAGTSGFAVPMPVANAVVTDLMAHGKVRRAWLGVEGDDLDLDEAQKLGVNGGATLSRVEPDSPAAAAGLKAGDVVVAVGEQAAHSMAELIALLPLHRPGDSVELTFYRNDRPLTIQVRLGERH